MIHVELSVEPHYKEVRYKPRTANHRGPWELAEGSPPPSILREWEFKTWNEVADWQTAMQFQTDSGSLEDLIQWGVDKPKEYAQVELELLDRTGQIYTCAGLSIEGCEDS